MDTNFTDNFLVKENQKFNLKDFNTDYKGELTKEEGQKMLEAEKKKLYELQEKLYADGSQSLLVVIQAMDAAGKDSLIEHVFGGVNPQGCEVTSFKTPTSKEYSHDFIWRHYLALPEKGKIGIFNRSHYESVLVCKVHPEYKLSEKVWKSTDEIDEKFWENRYESIKDFEKHVARNGTKIVKIFLHVSKEEQKKRLDGLLSNEDTSWRVSDSDRWQSKHYDKCLKVFDQYLNDTNASTAPWKFSAFQANRWRSGWRKIPPRMSCHSNQF